MSDLRSIDREKLREEIRKTMENDGVLHIPERFKDNNNYCYYLEIYDDRQPFKFQKCLSLGYTYTLAEEMPGLIEEMDNNNSKYSMINKDGRIAITINPHQTYFLMKIPKERWELIQEIKGEDYNNSIAKLKHKLKGSNEGDLSFKGSLTSTKN